MVQSQTTLIRVRVSVVGLRKLGSPLAAVLASAGQDVTAIDLRVEAVDALKAITAIGGALKASTAYHVVVVTSTVVPMSMDSEIRPALKRASGRQVGVSIGLCYNPMFIALGSVIHDLKNADVVLIGESDARAGTVVEHVQRSFIAERSEVRRMSPAGEAASRPGRC